MSEFGSVVPEAPSLPAARDGDTRSAHLELIRRAVAAVTNARRLVTEAHQGQALRHAERAEWAERAERSHGLRARALERLIDRSSTAGPEYEAIYTAAAITAGTELARASERLREAVAIYAQAQRRASEPPERMLVLLKAALDESLQYDALQGESGASDVRAEIVRWAIEAYYAAP